MDADLADRMLTAIEGNSLVVLCGAGLSMASPSKVPSAAELTALCVKRYRDITGSALPADVASDLEALAHHFCSDGHLAPTFIRQLIPWERFRRVPNSGHEAIGDFLGAGVLDSAITTNVDDLIENAAELQGEPDFYSCVYVDDVNREGLSHRYLLKLHGCCRKDRDNTVWCKEQLKVAPVSQRIDAYTTWLGGLLPNKDLIITGFWSDWEYLNAVLWKSIIATSPRAVVLVDPTASSILEEKAKELWRWANGHEFFRHVDVSGADFLKELRHLYSQRYLNRLLEQSRSTYETFFGDGPAGDVEIAGNLQDLVALRHDVEGVCRNKMTRLKKPEANQFTLGAFHIKFHEMHAAINGPNYVYEDKSYRLINAAGRVLSEVREQYADEPPALSTADVTVCVGATDDGGAPYNYVRGGSPGGVVRGGLVGEWINQTELARRLK